MTKTSSKMVLGIALLMFACISLSSCATSLVAQTRLEFTSQDSASGIANLNFTRVNSRILSDGRAEFRFSNPEGDVLTIAIDNGSNFEIGVAYEIGSSSLELAATLNQNQQSFSFSQTATSGFINLNSYESDASSASGSFSVGFDDGALAAGTFNTEGSGS